MAGTRAMGDWWDRLPESQRGQWCGVLAGQSDVSETMLDSIDEAYVGVVEDLWGGHPGWQPEWDEYWLINAVMPMYPWTLNPDFQAFVREHCRP